MELQNNFLKIVKENVIIDPPETADISAELCPVCGNEIIRNGRCKTCYSCGWSSCDI